MLDLSLVLSAADLTKKCKADSTLRAEVEYAIYNFPGVVTAAHKRHDTPPHFIFAVDNLIRMAVNGVLRVLSPGVCSKNDNRITC